MMGKYFQEAFTCPHCEHMIALKKDLAKYMDRNPKYCRGCGKKIADALAEALAIVKSE